MGGKRCGVGGTQSTKGDGDVNRLHSSPVKTLPLLWEQPRSARNLIEMDPNKMSLQQSLDAFQAAWIETVLSLDAGCVLC